MNRLTGSTIPNTIDWYLNSFQRLFSEIATLCGSDNLRRLGMALLSYGARPCPYPIAR
jgi:hypothetical protein